MSEPVLVLIILLLFIFGIVCLLFLGGIYVHKKEIEIYKKEVDEINKSE